MDDDIPSVVLHNVKGSVACPNMQVKDQHASNCDVSIADRVKRLCMQI
jgi:hypothetical protein